MPAPVVDPAIERANRLNAANMLRSMLPLVLICLVIVWWTTLRQSGDVGVRTVDPSTTVQLAAARAGYTVLGADRAWTRTTGSPARAPTRGTPGRVTR